MARHLVCGLVGFLALFLAISSTAHGAIPREILKQVANVNSRGPYYALLTTSVYSINVLMELGQFVPDAKYPYITVQGRLFRIGELEGKRVIITSTGSGLRNSGQTTQLLLVLFKVRGVILFGNAGNANPGLQIGDVTIAREWAHTGNWKWERFGGESTEDSNSFGQLKFSSFNDPESFNGVPVKNYLDLVSFRAEEIFPATETPEVGERIIWVKTSRALFRVTRQLEGVELQQCVNATICLPRKPVVVRGGRGVSANIFVDNKVYRDFLYSEFDANLIDKTTVGAALASREQNMAYIAIRGLSNSASGASTEESQTYGELATTNVVTVVLKFIKLLGSTVEDF